MPWITFHWRYSLRGERAKRWSFAQVKPHLNWSIVIIPSAAAHRTVLYNVVWYEHGAAFQLATRSEFNNPLHLFFCCFRFTIQILSLLVAEQHESGALMLHKTTIAILHDSTNEQNWRHFGLKNARLSFIRKWNFAFRFFFVRKWLHSVLTNEQWWNRNSFHPRAIIIWITPRGTNRSWVTLETFQTEW